MDDKKEVFGTIIKCMDGRFKEPVDKFMRGLSIDGEKANIDWFDEITGAGPLRALNDPEKFPEEMNLIRQKLDVSLNVHNSKIVAIMGHHDCAGNKCCDETQHKQLKGAVHYVKGIVPEDVFVFGLFVDAKKQVHTVDDKITTQNLTLRAMMLTLKEKFIDVLGKLLPDTNKKANYKKQRDMLLYKINANLASAEMTFDIVQYDKDGNIKEEFWAEHQKHLRALRENVHEFNSLVNEQEIEK
jgi:hypothetical protein